MRIAANTKQQHKEESFWPGVGEEWPVQRLQWEHFGGCKRRALLVRQPKLIGPQLSGSLVFRGCVWRARAFSGGRRCPFRVA